MSTQLKRGVESSSTTILKKFKSYTSLLSPSTFKFCSNSFAMTAVNPCSPESDVASTPENCVWPTDSKSTLISSTENKILEPESAIKGEESKDKLLDPPSQSLSPSPSIELSGKSSTPSSSSTHKLLDHSPSTPSSSEILNQLSSKSFLLSQSSNPIETITIIVNAIEEAATSKSVKINTLEKLFEKFIKHVEVECLKWWDEERKKASEYEWIPAGSHQINCNASSSFESDSNIMEWGFDLTHFGDQVDGALIFGKLLSLLGLPYDNNLKLPTHWITLPVEYRDWIYQPPFVWQSDDIMIVTGNNPITGEYALKNRVYPWEKNKSTCFTGPGGRTMRVHQIGYASYIGISGKCNLVIKAVKFIRQNAAYIKDESSLERMFI